MFVQTRPSTFSDNAASAAEDSNHHAVLLERARSGDSGAVSDLVTMFQPMVKGVARRCCRAADVDDVVQDVWVALCESVDTIRSPSCLPGWLKRVAVNAAIAKDRKNRALPLGDVPEPRLSDHEADPTSRPALVETTRRAVREAIKRLKESDRQLMEALMVDDRPDYTRVSQQIDRPIGSIGPLRLRALRRLSTDPTIIRLALADQLPVTPR